MFKNEIVYLPLAEVKKNEFATNENVYLSCVCGVVFLYVTSLYHCNVWFI
jgi:hypothetical protein